MKPRFSFISLCLMTWCTQALCAPNDSLNIQNKLLEVDRLFIQFRDQIWINPTIRYGKQTFSLTKIQTNGVHENRGKASLIEEGNKNRNVNININSFVVLNPSARFFGTASYHNGKREHIRWNENTDFNVIFPYVIGDSIGGFMKEEEYRFSGGYVRAFNQWRIGTEMTYRAMLAYRDKDPRPHNIVSDFDISLSISKQIGQIYNLATSWHLRKYNQASNISFLSDKGSSSVYQMLGLGMDYVRFAGSQLSAKYEGVGISGSLDLLPYNASLVKDGFSASIIVDYFHLSKEMGNMSNSSLNTLDHQKAILETSWVKQTKWLDFGLKLLGTYNRRLGKENIFGEPTANIYPQITSIDGLHYTDYHFLFSGALQQNIKNGISWGWIFVPRIAYMKQQSEYRAANRLLETSHFFVGANAKNFWQYSKWIFTTTADVDYKSNIQWKQIMPGINPESSVGEALLSNSRYLGDDRVKFALSLKADYAWSKQYALNIMAQWTRENYKVCGNTNLYELSLGIIF